MENTTIINLIKFIESKNPKYQIEYNDQGWIKLPHSGWRNKEYKKEGEWITDLGDRIRYDNYINGKREGIVKVNYQNGNPIVECQYKNDKKNGKFISYNIDGNPDLEGNYVNNKKIGEWIHYNENGKINGIETYE